MKPDLIILTNSFPNAAAKSEDWLYDEMKITNDFYNRILLAPDYFSNNFVELPANCVTVNVEDLSATRLNAKEMFNCLRIVISDFKAFTSKRNFFKAFRYNLSLVKKLHLKAKKINYLYHKLSDHVIVYAYWADNLATTSSIIKQVYMPQCKVVTRGHGFEIFEEQTRYGMIPFRNFQNRYLSKLFADSKKGMNHLNKKNSINPQINSYSYVGTKDCGMGPFDPAGAFSIVTCSHIREIKRLYLMAGILKHINFDLVWHVVGNGDGLEKLKQENEQLPSNIKVIYHGYLTNPEVLEFYKRTGIHLFISLSYSEGLPVTMMEAQSFGIPIMSTDVGGCSEICHDETGFLIKRDFDPVGVAQAITGFRNSSKNSVAFRESCRDHWKKNFNAEVNYKAFAKEITALH